MYVLLGAQSVLFSTVPHKNFFSAKAFQWISNYRDENVLKIGTAAVRGNRYFPPPSALRDKICEIGQQQDAEDVVKGIVSPFFTCVILW